MLFNDVKKMDTVVSGVIYLKHVGDEYKMMYEVIIDELCSIINEACKAIDGVGIVYGFDDMTDGDLTLKCRITMNELFWKTFKEKLKRIMKDEIVAFQEKRVAQTRPLFFGQFEKHILSFFSLSLKHIPI